MNKTPCGRALGLSRGGGRRGPRFLARFFAVDFTQCVRCLVPAVTTHTAATTSATPRCQVGCLNRQKIHTLSLFSKQSVMTFDKRVRFWNVHRLLPLLAKVNMAGRLSDGDGLSDVSMAAVSLPGALSDDGGSGSQRHAAATSRVIEAGQDVHGEVSSIPLRLSWSSHSATINISSCKRTAFDTRCESLSNGSGREKASAQTHSRNYNVWCTHAGVSTATFVSVLADSNGSTLTFDPDVTSSSCQPCMVLLNEIFLLWLVIARCCYAIATRACRASHLATSIICEHSYHHNNQMHTFNLHPGRHHLLYHHHHRRRRRRHRRLCGGSCCRTSTSIRMLAVTIHVLVLVGFVRQMAAEANGNVMSSNGHHSAVSPDMLPPSVPSDAWVDGSGSPRRIASPPRVQPKRVL